MRKKLIRLIEGDPRVIRTPTYLDVKRVAEALGVSRTTVYSWLEGGLLRAVKVRRQTKVSSRSLREFLRRRAAGEMKLRAELPSVRVMKNLPSGRRVRPPSKNALWGFDEHGQPWLIG